MRKLLKTTQWFSVAHSLSGMLETGTEYVAMKNSVSIAFTLNQMPYFIKIVKMFLFYK